MCYAQSCTKVAEHEIRGIRMCSEHYIEALDHCAHLCSKTPEQPVFKVSTAVKLQAEAINAEFSCRK